MNKRDFLRLACAAPVIGPVIAKHVATSQPIYGSGRFIDWADYRGSVVESLAVSPNESIMLRGAPRIAGACFTEQLGDGRVSYSVELQGSATVPNRLHGAFIKEDGDAA